MPYSTQAELFTLGPVTIKNETLGPALIQNYAA